MFIFSFAFSQECTVDIESYNLTYISQSDALKLEFSYFDNSLSVFDTAKVVTDYPSSDTLSVTIDLVGGNDAQGSIQVPLQDECGIISGSFISIQNGVCEDTINFSFNPLIFRPCPN